MDSLDLQVLSRRATGAGEGRAVWLVSVIETWGSAPRPPGALLAMRDDGVVVGSVSGGCVEDDLIDRVRKGERVATPSLVTYGVSKEEAARFGLPCGGNLRLVQEPLGDTAGSTRCSSARRATSSSPASSTSTAASCASRPRGRGEAFLYDGKTMRALYGPRWRMLVIGAGQLSRSLAQMALGLDFEVVVCDPREEYGLAWDVPGTTFSTAMPDDLAIEMRLDPHTAVVAVTHDPKLDDLALSRRSSRRRSTSARSARAATPPSERSGSRCSTSRPRSSGCTARSASTSAARRRPRSRSRSWPRSSR